jgi:transposase
MMETTNLTLETEAAIPASPVVGQRRSAEERRRIVEASLKPGAAASQVAAQYGIHVTHLYWLRRQYREGRLGGKATPTKLVPVAIMPGGNRRTVKPAGSVVAGSIAVELPRGQIRVVGAVDGDALRLVLEALSR